MGVFYSGTGFERRGTRTDFEIDDAMLSWEFKELMAEELEDGWKQLKTAPDCSFAGMEDVEKRFSVWYRDTIGQVERK